MKTPARIIIGFLFLGVAACATAAVLPPYGFMTAVKSLWCICLLFWAGTFWSDAFPKKKKKKYKWGDQCRHPAEFVSPDWMEEEIPSSTPPFTTHLLYMCRRCDKRVEMDERANWNTSRFQGTWAHIGAKTSKDGIPEENW